MATLFWLNCTASRLVSDWNLRLYEVKTQGKVVEMASRGYGSNARSLVSYTYQVGQIWHGQSQVSESTWYTLRKGGPITVWYLPGQPDQHEIVKGDAVWSDIFLLCLTLVPAFCSSAGVWRIFRRARQMVIVGKTGLKRSARVSAMKLKDIPGGKFQRWQIQWQDEAEESGSGVQAVCTQWNILPRVGTTIAPHRAPQSPALGLGG